MSKARRMAGVVDHVPALSKSTMLQGDLSLTNTVKKLGAGKFLYTGNGTSQEINIGVSSIDFTQASNGTGYYHDRVAGDGIVKTDAGVIVESGEIAFKDVAGVDGILKVHIKKRAGGIIDDNGSSHMLFDGIRGAGRRICTNLTVNESSGYNQTFSNIGFVLNTGLDVLNAGTRTYVAYIELYTHIKWGLTSQGKRYIEAYNPVTNMGMILYQGSGVAGHQIPHSAGVVLDVRDIKKLNLAQEWVVETSLQNNLFFPAINVNAGTDNGADYSTSSAIYYSGGWPGQNALNDTYITYYKAKSKIWTCGIYTGSAGTLEVETVDSDGVARRPARVTIKTVTSLGDWHVMDSKRGEDLFIYLNQSASEGAGNYINITSTGFFLGNGANPSWLNGSNVQHLYLVEFDTDDTGTGDSYFDNPTDTTQLQLTDGIYSISDGYSNNGAVNEIASKTGTVIPTTGWKE